MAKTKQTAKKGERVTIPYKPITKAVRENLPTSIKMKNRIPGTVVLGNITKSLRIFKTT